MTIDFHTHCFPEKIAERALSKLAFVSGGMETYTDGTVQSLQKTMQTYDVQRSVVLNIATNAHQQKSVNDFAASINNEQDIISFGSVFPDAPDALEELERIHALGLKGIKFHPDYQGFFVDDPKCKPIYEKISALGLITVFHAGFDYGYEPPFHCMPEAMERALKWFSSPVIAAHWGGLNCGEAVIEHLCGKEIYLDLSFGYSQMPKKIAEQIIAKHGTDRILFATDMPWHTPAMERRLIESLPLTAEDKEKIYYKNAERLLAL